MSRITTKLAAAACAVSAASILLVAGCGDAAKQMAGNLGSTVAGGLLGGGGGGGGGGNEQQQQQLAGNNDNNANQNGPVPTQMQLPDAAAIQSARSGGGTFDQQLATALQPQQAAAHQGAVNNGRGVVQTLGNDRYRAVCSDFVASAAEQQKTDVWCWAACVQMVNKYNGVDVTQAEIASRIHGQATDANGNLDPEKVKRAGTTEIMLALNPEFSDDVNRQAGDAAAAAVRNRGKVSLDLDATSTALAVFREKAYTDNDMIADVARGVPVVVGLKDPTGNTGHAYVVHAATYTATKGALPGQYSYALESVEAVDPWEGKGVSIPAGEFRQRVGFKISQARAREVLERHRNAVKVK